jgi:hypothetical protein
MSTPTKSIFDGMEYLYAEQLKGKRVTLTIKAVEQKEIIGDGGRKSMGFAVHFNETKKKLIVAGATVRRQLAMVCQSENPDDYAGKQIILYAVPSSRSVSGLAIRIALPEHAA